MKHIIIDGTNFACIALYGIIGRMKKEAPDKIDIWWEASFRKLFLQMLRKLIKEFRDTSLYYIAWDGKLGSAWRKEAVPEYKATREHLGQTERALSIAHELAEECLVTNIDIECAEADDVIFALSKLLSSQSEEVVIVSRDQDMIQIVQKSYASCIWNPVAKKFMDIPEYDIVKVKALAGDVSDNIPGLPSIGTKRAIKLLESELDEVTEAQMEPFLQIIDMSRNPHHKQIYTQLELMFCEGVDCGNKKHTGFRKGIFLR